MPPTLRLGDRRWLVFAKPAMAWMDSQRALESPNLAGQIETYLVKAITEYRNEVRKNESMNIVAKDLTDDDIADLAAYYSSIQVDVVPPLVRCHSACSLHAEGERTVSWTGC